MQITSITPQKTNKNFYNIFIDHEFFCGLDDESIYHMKLKEGMEVDKELLLQAADEAAYKKAMNYSLNLISKYLKTKQEVVKKLKEKEYHEETIKKVTDKLEALGYLNDERYVEVYIRNKKDSGSILNKRTIYNKLLQKGIDRELVRTNLDHSEIDEYESALKAAHKKLPNLKGDIRTKKSKLYIFLCGKGFDYEICSKVLNNLEITE
jgi:regulatory protein